MTSFPASSTRGGPFDALFGGGGFTDFGGGGGFELARAGGGELRTSDVIPIAGGGRDELRDGGGGGGADLTFGATGEAIGFGSVFS